MEEPVRIPSIALCCQGQARAHGFSAAGQRKIYTGIRVTGQPAGLCHAETLEGTAVPDGGDVIRRAVRGQDVAFPKQGERRGIAVIRQEAGDHPVRPCERAQTGRASCTGGQDDDSIRDMAPAVKRVKGLGDDLGRQAAYGEQDAIHAATHSTNSHCPRPKLVCLPIWTWCAKSR